MNALWQPLPQCTDAPLLIHWRPLQGGKDTGSSISLFRTFPSFVFERWGPRFLTTKSWKQLCNWSLPLTMSSVSRRAPTLRNHFGSLGKIGHHSSNKHSTSRRPPIGRELVSWLMMILPSKVKLMIKTTNKR